MMKGLICRQLYGEYCDHRPSGDEDILIRKAEYKQVQQIPQEIGYRPKYQGVTETQLDDLQEVTFYNRQTGLSIEVHVTQQYMRMDGEDNWMTVSEIYFKTVQEK